MSSKEQKFTSSRVRSSYLSVVVSMTLVLFVMGLLGNLLFSAKELGKAVRENFTFTLVLDEDVPEEELRTLLKSQQLASYTKSAELITKEEAALQLQEDLGEDFVEFLGYNPLSNTIDLHLDADFVANGDLDALKERLMSNDDVTEVLYDPDLIGLVNDNIEKISLVLVGASLVLLFVALALINSSIRLTIYSKRFLLKTMQLVGATSGFIRKPYVLNSLLLGSISAVLSMAMLYGVGVALGNYFPTFIALISIETTLMVFGLMLLMSLVVPGISTAIAIRKYLKLRTNELYF
jgi:cell division transport system permease protein